jgi:hypothetical protein
MQLCMVLRIEEFYVVFHSLPFWDFFMCYYQIETYTLMLCVNYVTNLFFLTLFIPHLAQVSIQSWCMSLVIHKHHDRYAFINYILTTQGDQVSRSMGNKKVEVIKDMVVYKEWSVTQCKAPDRCFFFWYLMGIVRYHNIKVKKIGKTF